MIVNVLSSEERLLSAKAEVDLLLSDWSWQLYGFLKFYIPGSVDQRSPQPSLVRLEAFSRFSEQHSTLPLGTEILAIVKK